MSSGLQFDIILSSIIYALIGVVLMVAAVLFANRVFSLDLKREIKDDHNIAAGIVIAGIMVSVAFIVAAAIH